VSSHVSWRPRFLETRCESRRPVTLRPHLSVSLPFSVASTLVVDPFRGLFHDIGGVRTIFSEKNRHNRCGFALRAFAHGRLGCWGTCPAFSLRVSHTKLNNLLGYVSEDLWQYILRYIPALRGQTASPTAERKRFDLWSPLSRHAVRPLARIGRYQRPADARVLHRAAPALRPGRLPA
jgi:hypothetical protein